ncbi:MAG: UpxY family transcription antiterminator [Deltaproteobacteria bacterium]|nr:UpxY family transcription antiterminator [Deltaproteobacteria bacterium]MBW2140532.1 UpxY family transcription antiterminator [Deltaproteobacteria bacterium]MBW2322469.1 UpxY family transcription antiterminator [Deltaproteobacteria bacterium]
MHFQPENEMAMKVDRVTVNNCQSNQRTPNWYAVYTRSNFESKAYTHLSQKSINAFLPKIQVTSNRQGRCRKILRPLFSGYLFVNIDLSPENHLEIIKSTGVVYLVGINDKPVPINEEEIANLMILDETDQPLQDQAYLKKGDKVIITEGPLKGLIGFYLVNKQKVDRVVVSIDFLKRSLAVELNCWALEKFS